jgi:hypothetical protein
MQRSETRTADVIAGAAAPATLHLQLLPAVRHAWLIQEWGPGLADEARSAGVEVICPRANALSKVAVDEIKAAGFGVRAWGVKDERVGLWGAGARGCP